jgi:hypothetical protein
MASAHFISMDGLEFTAVFHIPTPVGNNTSGVPWSTIALRFGGGAVSSLPDGDGTLGTISAAEKASLANGSLIELTKVIRWNSAFPTGPQADAIFATVSSAFLADMQTRYARYGATR